VTNEEKARIQALIDQLLSGKKPPQPSTVTERVYEDEPILRRASQLPRRSAEAPRAAEPTPSKIRQMRKLNSQYGYAARLDAKVFLRQAKFMADYEADQPWEGYCELYYPSYESMTDRQLEGYFTWRSWVRAGRLEDAPRGFVQVYCFELLNGIGVDSPEEAHQRLTQLLPLCENDPSLRHQLRTWIHDLVIWHGMDIALLPEGQSPSDFQEQINTLLHYQNQPYRSVCEALAAVSSYRLENAKFYKLHPDEVSEVVWRVFDALWYFHEKNRKTGLMEHLIGRHYESPYHPFPSVLRDRNELHPDAVYEVSELHQFICKDGNWTQKRFFAHSGKSKPAGTLLRQIDYCLRQAYGFKSTLKPAEISKVWQGIIDKVIAAFMAEQAQKAQLERDLAAAAAKKAVAIDLSKLQGIRSAALVTQQKLIVDEEEPYDEPEPTAEPEPELQEAQAGDTDEIRLLRCLLRGQPLDWIRSEGKLLSVLVDAANERFYEEFADTVLEYDGETPVLIEDYIDDLKGIIGE